MGEDLQVVLVSTTEGEDKPLKYPKIFDWSDVCLITKMDIADVLGFDREQMRASIETVKPRMPVFELSARTGWGMDEWIAYLVRRYRGEAGKPRRDRKFPFPTRTDELGSRAQPCCTVTLRA